MRPKARGPNATYIPPGCVGVLGSCVGVTHTHVGLTGTRVGSVRFLRYQDVGILNAKWSTLSSLDLFIQIDG